MFVSISLVSGLTPFPCWPPTAPRAPNAPTALPLLLSLAEPKLWAERLRLLLRVRLENVRAEDLKRQENERENSICM